MELYGAYTETEAVFRIDRLLELYSSLPPDEQEEFCFDPAVVDWPTFLRDVYLPAVVAHARVRLATPRRPRQGPRAVPREERARRAVLSPDRQLAVFDLENTLIATNVVDSYAWLATRRMDLPERARFTVRTLLEAPRMLSLDMLDRGDFLRWFYRRYEDADLDELRAESWELASDLLAAKAFPAGIRRVREHRALGHRTLLITGALDFLIEPFQPLFDDVICAHMTQVNGMLSGELDESPRPAKPAPWSWPNMPRPTGSTSLSASCTPTRPATCQCSRPPVTLWRSTPKQSSPPSPASEAGTSNIGRALRATSARCCPLDQ